ncbi:serine/threonine/dual specificity protein kinase, catalytic domain-containing protein [Artemisia annua]|uniref:Serine/threonine/dual specificity protein kinase, catalytic domain-containing protein n=1 Tax=Artemisia annua TaxID=35608 RepID=A0A2U1L4L2_ARTAN|nr:serine/threonine/dual specificity protein kinase, catalytic domain-containing protein [Artemisia annua]
MASFMTELKHLEIQLEDIISATNNFDESKVIGRGGFGKVYARELSQSQSGEKSLVAIKRLDRRYGQGDPEFFKEIRMLLSCYRHENLISLLGFCKQGRLRICIDAAKGLCFLHDPNGTQQRVLHCDVKSANILLDKNMTAKVSDFGLSKMGPANQQYSLLITNAVGTPGYCDPLYMQTYTLTKESDVYSFGVVLFEVLCGRLCAEINNGKLVVYVPFWKKIFKEKRLDEIIFPELIPQMGPDSLKTYADIAFQCLKKSRKERPTMSLVVEKLEKSLEFQMFHDLQLPNEYKEIIEVVVPPLKCRSLKELKALLSKGFYVNDNTWLSMNSKGERIVMVSIQDYLTLDDMNRDYCDPSSFEEKSRFKVGFYKTCLMEFKLRVRKPLFLSPDVTYGLNLVFCYSEIQIMKQQHVGIRYKLQREKTISIVHFADKKENKWLVAELYQFTSTEESILDLEIFLEDCGLSGDLYIEGIEFRPLEKVERQVVIANQEIVRGVVPPLFYRFTEESEVLLSQGVLLNRGKTVNSYNPLRYKIDGEDETKVFIIYPTDMREDGWFTAPLYQFTSQYKTTDLQFVFEPRWISLLVAGIEFQPSKEKVQLQVFEEYKEIVKVASQSLFYTSLDELKQILSKGVCLNGHKTWCSLDKKGEHCKMISIEDCLIPNQDFPPRYESHYLSRFPSGLYQTNKKGFKTHVKAQLLSPLITYTVNLVFYVPLVSDQHYVDLRYRLRGETTTSAVYLGNRRGDDLLFIAELYQFTSDGSIIELEITFDNHGSNLQVEGILFQPLEIVEDQVSKKDKVENIQTVSDSESDTYLEQKFRGFSDRFNDLFGLWRFRGFSEWFSEIGVPARFSELGDWGSVFPVRWVQQPGSVTWFRGFSDRFNDLFGLWRFRGFSEWFSEIGVPARFSELGDWGSVFPWFTVDKHEKKCLMLSARATWVINDKNSACESSNESRFGEVLVITTAYEFEIKMEVKSKLVSPTTTYAAYLVFKLPQDQSTFEVPIEVKDGSSDYLSSRYFIYLVSPPHTPIIEQTFDVKTYNPLNRYKGNAIPQRRNDGWMEVQVWTFQTAYYSNSMRLKLQHSGYKDLCGLMVQGIELRPV